MLGRCSAATYPIPGTSLEIHNSEDSKLLFLYRVEEGIGEPLTEATSDGPKYDRPSLWVLDDGAVHRRTSRISERTHVRFHVSTCSQYSDRRQASIREMEEIAWVLRSDAQPKRIGLVPARELNPRERYVLPGEWD